MKQTICFYPNQSLAMREPKTFLFSKMLINNLVEYNIKIFHERKPMAISRDKKQALVSELSDLLGSAKMTVFAHYDGLTVADVQKLRRAAREQGVTIKVVKNRLVRVALSQNENLKSADTSSLTGQLLYAVSSEDEVAPAQALANFAKTNDALKLVGAFSAEGKLLVTDEVKALATLPSKNELIAQVLATLSSPVNDVMSGLSGNLHALLDGVEAKATA